jgi:uncharacterized membrane protein
MRAWKSALAIAVCALGLGLLPAAHAQFKPSAPGGGGGPGGPGGGAPAAQGDTFQFKVCNRSRITLHIAMLYKDGNAWRTVGWINYKPNECAPVRGTFPRNDFFWYAEDGPGNVTYGGKDAYGCVHPSDGFNRTVTGDYQCGPGEKVVGFTKIDDKSVQDGITLTD